MRVPKRPLTLTKEHAAVRQVEAAIHALMRGDFDVAVTLACAAEGMFNRTGRHLFAVLRDHPTAKGIPKKVWIAHLNRDRDWLKHPEGPDELVIERFSATAAIIRAATKLEHWTPLIEAFKEWYDANHEEILAE
jgi:hypothetical protein